MTEMHDVVEMLLTRIKDYPEDFISAPSDYRDQVPTKWYQALQIARDVMTDDEKFTTTAALDLARRTVYMGFALKKILSDEVPEETQKKQYFGPAIGQAITDTRGIMTSAALRNQASQILNHTIRNEYSQVYQDATNNT